MMKKRIVPRVSNCTVRATVDHKRNLRVLKQDINAYDRPIKYSLAARRVPESPDF